MKRTNFYVTGDGATWRFTKAEFRRQLKNVANGGYIDVDKGTRVAENMVRLDDANDPEVAKAWLAEVDNGETWLS
tara:strand:+ start:16483 stop:16707 length:225 start_codon:yes stop_codon:yes gene_type:complete